MSKSVAGEGLIGADAPLAEDDLFVALCHDVLSAHQQLLDGIGQTPLEQDGLVKPAQLF